MTDQALVKELAALSYQKINDRISTIDSEKLVDLLDCTSIKVGDSVADLLARRGEYKLVAKSLRETRIKNRLGKIRALWIVGLCHDSYGDEASRLYKSCLNDRSDDVVDSALFGLVLLRAKDAIKDIEYQLGNAQPGSKKHTLMNLAKRALEVGDPTIYAPNFQEADDIA